jgi:hypothetical protein
VVSRPDGSFRAIFGYSNAGPATTVPVGRYNWLFPDELNGLQPTAFATGSRTTAFATPFLPKDSIVAWTVQDRVTFAYWRIAECGPGVTLPAEGNGIGPVVVIVLSVMATFAVGWLRSWRAGRRRTA